MIFRLRLVDYESEESWFLEPPPEVEGALEYEEDFRALVKEMEPEAARCALAAAGTDRVRWDDVARQVVALLVERGWREAFVPEARVSDAGGIDTLRHASTLPREVASAVVLHNLRSSLANLESVIANSRLRENRNYREAFEGTARSLKKEIADAEAWAAERGEEGKKP